MTIRENILSDIDKIGNPALLNQVFEYIQLLTLNKSIQVSNKDAIIKLSGSLSNKDAEELTNIIAEEFNNIEGDW